MRQPSTYADHLSPWWPWPFGVVELKPLLREPKLSAIALHQIAYGLVLIGGFSLGLTSVLTTLRLAAVYGQQWLENSPLGAGVMQRLSVVSALVTVCIDLGLTTMAVMG